MNWASDVLHVDENIYTFLFFLQTVQAWPSTLSSFCCFYATE